MQFMRSICLIGLHECSVGHCLLIGQVYSVDMQLQLALVILLPIVVLFLGVLLILFLCRYRHRQHMDELSARQRFLHYDGDIEAEPIGDSTLQVLSQCLVVVGDQLCCQQIMLMSFYSLNEK